jgi:hypothetical protein
MALRYTKEHHPFQADLTLFTDSLCSIQLINQAVFWPDKLKTHKHYALLANIATLLQERTAQGRTTAIKKVKSHIGIRGNELADQGANRAARGPPLPTDTVLDEPTSSAAYTQCVWLASKKSDAQGRTCTWPMSNLTSSVKAHVMPKWQGGHAPVGKYQGWQDEVRPHVSQPHSAGYWNHCPFSAIILNLKLNWGLVWNAGKAARCAKPRPGQPTPSGQCPLCHAPDSGSHIYGGCKHPSMQAHYISRHNGAVQRLTKLIHTGSATQNCYTIMDATAADALPTGVSDNRIPAWILPAVPEATRLKMRPDIMIIEGLRNEDVEAFQQMGSYQATAMRQYTVHVIEVGYAANTRYLEKLQEKKEQHTRLCEALAAEGWRVQNTDNHQIILGTGGNIHGPTEALLNSLGVADDDKRKSALRKLSALAVNKGQHIITCRRQLEAALRGAHQHGPFRYR